MHAHGCACVCVCVCVCVFLRNGHSRGNCTQQTFKVKYCNMISDSDKRCHHNYTLPALLLSCSVYLCNLVCDNVSVCVCVCKCVFVCVCIPEKWTQQGKFHSANFQGEVL
eukprot:TRINITY_DN72646_c0_g1_i3.p2 TRINITY_DN72646_c0_g1~~TRINITY_DN72646_c0_g1_i3.p2  ORF type:complete len:110 (-),score=23.49 TRINITY_DN72646_c0_g1_i3:143-472(-)